MGVVEEHKNKTDILEAIILSYYLILSYYFYLEVIILLRNLPEGFAMGNLTDHEGRTTKA